MSKAPLQAGFTGAFFAYSCFLLHSSFEGERKSCLSKIRKSGERTEVDNGWVHPRGFIRWRLKLGHATNTCDTFPTRTFLRSQEGNHVKMSPKNDIRSRRFKLQKFHRKRFTLQEALGGSITMHTRDLGEKRRCMWEYINPYKHPS